MTQPVLEPLLEYFGDGEILSEKPADCLTYEEIVYTYANLNDYNYVGHYVNKDGKIERLYQAK
jgi:hypothetical protein